MNAMSPSKPLAKLSPPRLRQAFARERLFKRLDHARRFHPVLWISSPAGAGKTTLIASYAQARKLPCVWYQIDEGDADVASFFYYMGLAAGKGARRNAKLPLLTPEYRACLAVFSRNYFRELFARVKRPCLVVLDNYEEAPEDAALHDALAQGLEEVPADVNVVIISRTEPPAALGRLSVTGDLELIGWNSLRLTVPETTRFLAAHGRTKPDKDTITSMHRCTDGWPAGLVLLMQHSCSGTEPNLADAVHSASGREAIFEYFTAALFDREPRETQLFLVKTALLPSIEIAIAATLTGNRHAEQILKEFARKNYFTVRRADTAAYSYHPLFRDFLLTRLHRLLDETSLTALRLHAAQLLSETGRVDEAADLYRAAQAWDALAVLATRHAPQLLHAGRYDTLHEWLTAISAELARTQPQIEMWLGASRQPFDLNEARQHYEQAFTGFKQAGDAVHALLAWAGLIDTFVYEWGNFTPLDRWIPEFEPLYERAHAALTPDIETRVVAGIFNALMYRQPDNPNLATWAERLERLMENNPDSSLRMLVGIRLLHYQSWWMGNQAKATRLVEDLEMLAQSPNLPPLTCVAWHAIKSGYAWQSGDNALSLAAARQGLAIADETGVHVLDFMLLANGAWASLTSEDLAEARRLLKQAHARLNPRRRLDTCHYHYQMYIEASHRDDGAAMLEHAQEALRHARDGGVPWAQALMLTSVGRAHHALGKHREARQAQQEALDIGQAIGSAIAIRGAWFALAELEQDAGNESAALEYLRQVLALCREHGYANWAVWRSASVARMCATALEHGIEPEYVRWLIRKRQVRPNPPPLTLRDWPWPVRVHTLGRFSLVVNDKPLHATHKIQNKPLELLQLLVAFGGRNVPVGRVVDALWPHAEGDAARRNLDINVHRLRRLLGHEESVEMHGGKLILDARYAWVDAWAFERIANELHTASEANPTSENTARMADLTRKLFELYQGEFLEGTEAPWALRARERMSGKFSRAVLAAGKYWDRVGQPDKAISVYEQAIEKEPSTEAFYRILHDSLVHLGRETDAARVDRRRRRALLATLTTQGADEA